MSKSDKLGNAIAQFVEDVARWGGRVVQLTVGYEENGDERVISVPGDSAVPGDPAGPDVTDLSAEDEEA